MVLGLFSENPPLDMRALIHKELKIMGSAFFGTSEHGPEFRASTKILPHFKDELKVLQTHQFPLSRVADAFEAAVSKDDRPIKVTTHPRLLAFRGDANRTRTARRGLDRPRPMAGRGESSQPRTTLLCRLRFGGDKAVASAAYCFNSIRPGGLEFGAQAADRDA